jgi:FMN phosphatase YigB (HAD superfamily)
MTRIRAVVFDVGETLVDETSVWDDWAAWLGVPRFTFFGAMGGGIALRLGFHEVFDMIRPGIDVDAERRARTAAGRRPHVSADDLYPDAVPCLRALVAAGFRVGIAANQPEATEAVLHGLDLPLALVASSERWGVHKPDPAFFRRVCEELGLPGSEIAYVGDRLDNDVTPAAAAGMTAIFIRRGPWALVQAATVDPSAVGAAAVIGGLAELPGVLAAMADD